MGRGPINFPPNRVFYVQNIKPSQELHANQEWRTDCLPERKEGITLPCGSSSLWNRWIAFSRLSNLDVISACDQFLHLINLLGGLRCFISRDPSCHRPPSRNNLENSGLGPAFPHQLVRSYWAYSVLTDPEDYMLKNYHFKLLAVKVCLAEWWARHLDPLELNFIFYIGFSIKLHIEFARGQYYSEVS